MYQSSSKEQGFVVFSFFYCLHYFKAAAFLKTELVIMLPLMYPVMFVRYRLFVLFVANLWTVVTMRELTFAFFVRGTKIHYCQICYLMTSRNCVLSFEHSSLLFLILLLCHICKISALVVSCFPLYSDWTWQCQYKTFDHLLAWSFDTSFPGSLLAWVSCPCSGKALVTGDEELCLCLFRCHQLAGGKECFLW